MAASSARLVLCQSFARNFSVKSVTNVVNNCSAACALQTRKYFSSSSSGSADDPPDGITTGSPKRDIVELFMDSRVQEILVRLTGMDLDKIFEFTPTPHRSSQRYEFMTERALEKAMVDARVKARRRLQMPPYLDPREPIDDVLSEDRQLKYLNTVKYIFTDISIGVPNRKRMIVARDADGTLRKASWEERDRMIITFFPKPQQKYGTPRVFLDEHMTAAFDEGKHKFVLDRACHQYEPDNPAFIEICREAYEHVDRTNGYDVLHSTRHYGRMMFYLAAHRRIDGIVQHLIQKDRIEEAADVVRLYHLLHPDCKSRHLTVDDADLLAILKVFTSNDAVRRSHLELALQTYEELEKQRLAGHRNEAHGSAS